MVFLPKFLLFIRISCGSSSYRGFFHDGASTAASLLEEIFSCLAEISEGFFHAVESSSDLFPNFLTNSLLLVIGTTTTNHLILQLKEGGLEERRENNGNYEREVALFRSTANQ